MIPPQPLEKKPGQLEQWQLEEFFDKGFVLVPKFFTKEELQPVLKVGIPKHIINIELFGATTQFENQCE